MNLVDANVLLYAVDISAEHHELARTWLDEALSGTDLTLIPWVSLLAFVRISTHPSVYEHPLTVNQAFDVVDAWLTSPAVVASEADESHSSRLRQLLDATGRGGNLVTDAHLASLALQYGAIVISFDSDFTRFPGVRWKRPSIAVN